MEQASYVSRFPKTGRLFGSGMLNVLGAMPGNFLKNLQNALTGFCFSSPDQPFPWPEINRGMKFQSCGYWRNSRKKLLRDILGEVP